MAEIMDNQTGAPEEITKKDVTKAYLRWHFANEIPHSLNVTWRHHYYTE